MREKRAEAIARYHRKLRDLGHSQQLHDILGGTCCMVRGWLCEGKAIKSRVICKSQIKRSPLP
jgi:hypothetical protein